VRRSRLRAEPGNVGRQPLAPRQMKVSVYLEAPLRDRPIRVLGHRAQGTGGLTRTQPTIDGGNALVGAHATTFAGVPAPTHCT